MRWYHGVILLLLALVVVVPVPRLAAGRSEAPTYAGKTIDQWLDAGYEDSAMALEQIGPSAAPYVLAKLSREDARYGSAHAHRRLWARLPRAIRALVARPQTGNFDEWRATSALLEMGPRVIPLVGDRLQDHNAAVRAACAHTLLLLRRQGADIRPTVGRLQTATRDVNPEVAKWAVAALGPSVLLEPTVKATASR